MKRAFCCIALCNQLMEFSSSDLPQENVLEEVELTWICSILFTILNGESYLTFMLTLIQNKSLLPAKKM